MKKNINYEKDIIFKSHIASITTISLEHDFTVDDNKLKGEFIVSGEYKVNELSVNQEKFNYRLPLEYDLEDNVDLDTLTYDIENFEYNVNDDTLSVYIDFGVRYEELKAEPIIPEISSDELNDEINIDSFRDANVELDDVVIPKENSDIDVKDFDDQDNTFVTYHVHIVREGDSLESIADKYGVSVEKIKEYNTIDVLELKSKLIIPKSNE